MWNNSYRTHSGCWQKTLGISKKASQSPQNETGQKIRIKKETKDFRTRTCAMGKGVLKAEMFPHTLKPSHRQSLGGALDPQQVLGRQNGEKSPQTVTKQHSPGKKWLICPQQRVQAQSSGFRGQTPGTGLALAVMKIF